MKLKGLICLWGLVLSGLVFADISSRLNITEEDGAPSTYPYKAKFSNGTVTDNGDGTVSISNALSSGSTQYIQNTLTPTTTSQMAVLQQIQISSNTIFSGATFYQNGPVSISTNVVIANNGGFTAQWDASAPTGSTLLLGTSHNFTSADETAGTSVNSVYDFISGSYNWGIHAHMPAGTGNHRRGFVAGGHGASDTAYSAVVDDTNNTATPLHIYQSGPNGNTAQSLIQLDGATDWRDGTPLGVFTGHFMTAFTSGTAGTPVYQLDYDGATRIKDVNGTVPITLESSGNVVASQLVIKNDMGAGYSMINYVGVAADSWLVGAANGAESLFGVANRYFFYDQTAGAMRMTIDSTGKVSIPGAGSLSVSSNTLIANTTFYQDGRIIFGGMYLATADQTINTVTETSGFSGTSIGTTTVPANWFVQGKKLVMNGQGVYSTPLANTATLQIKVKYGSTQLATVTTGALPASASNLPFYFWVICTVRSIGASGSMICNGNFAYDTALTGVVETQNALISNIQTIDTTASAKMDVTATWSAVTTQTATVQQSSIDFKD